MVRTPGLQSNSPSVAAVRQSLLIRCDVHSAVPHVPMSDMCSSISQLSLGIGSVHFHAPIWNYLDACFGHKLFKAPAQQTDRSGCNRSSAVILPATSTTLDTSDLGCWRALQLTKKGAPVRYPRLQPDHLHSMLRSRKRLCMAMTEGPQAASEECRVSMLPSSFSRCCYCRHARSRRVSNTLGLSSRMSGRWGSKSSARRNTSRTSMLAGSGMSCRRL